MRRLPTLGVCVLGVCAPGAIFVLSVRADEPAANDARNSILASVDPGSSRLRTLLERYETDRSSLGRFHRTPLSPERAARMKQFQEEWRAALEALDFDSLGQPGRIDYVLLRNEIEHELRELEIRDERAAEMLPLIPFGRTIVAAQEARRRLDPVDPVRVAEELAELTRRIEEARTSLKPGDGSTGTGKVKRSVAHRAADTVDRLRRSLSSWYGFYRGYDPLFTWWVSAPYEEAEKALRSYASFLRENLVGVKEGDRDTIVGDPIGRDALLSELAYEMIPYTPEELIEIAESEFDWCDREMLRASRDLGFGDDWRKALEHVKSLHVPPGKQPELIRDLARESERFLKERDLLTIPPLCSEIWRMEMMSPERQRVNPYFTGGEVISVSFPTQEMAHRDKLMSLRGNNIHFSRATVHHELIPGHHLQGFMSARYNTQRRLFRTPFWVEGWALYWEMLLWDLDFQRSAEDRVGMLFWRRHRCARIIFSLSFHLEKMTAEEAIEFLIERVGHERNNATAEVRRSFAGNYGPLYQAAYMLGGLQIRALHRELVQSGKMTNRDFHDSVLRENAIPIEMIRASLTGQKLAKDFRSSWRFYDK